MTQRVRMRLQEDGFRREIIDSVLKVRDPLENLPDTLLRLQLLTNLAERKKVFRSYAAVFV